MGGFSACRVWLILWAIDLLQEEEAEEKVKGEEWRRNCAEGRRDAAVRAGRERRVIAITATTKKEERKSAGGTLRKSAPRKKERRRVTWGADRSGTSSAGTLAAAFRGVFMRTRGGKDGETSQGEETEEVIGFDRLPSALRGGRSTLPSWPCMDGDGESRMP